MAYNALSGTVIAAQKYLPGDLYVENIVSGNLSTSDGSSTLNIPRVSNATNNALLTNVGGDANTLTCETNLTFDGTALSITGELTASTGLSASYLMGDGSRLTGLPTQGGGGGIFTTPNATTAYTTSSINVGSSATPSYTLTVAGTASINGHLIVTGSAWVTGTMNVDGDLLPSAASTHNLGSVAKPWGALYVDASTIYMGTDTITVADNNLKFGSGSTTKGFDVGFMNFKNNGIFMDPGRLFKLRAYQIQMFGGIGYVRKVAADDYTIKETDYLIGVASDLLTASVTLTLPAASGLLNGQTFVVKDEGGAANTYPVTIACTGSDVVDGANQVVLESPYAAIQLYCNGVGKFFIC